MLEDDDREHSDEDGLSDGGDTKAARIDARVGATHRVRAPWRPGGQRELEPDHDRCGDLNDHAATVVTSKGARTVVAVIPASAGA